MSAHATLLLCALNLALITALPRIFFRRGRLNLHWWLTAAPFGLAGAALLVEFVAPGATLAGGLTAAVYAPAIRAAALLFATVLAAGSILLIGLTLGSHAEPVSLWHQQDDTPRHIVRHGAYARIRHPFYAAFLLALAACVLTAPGAVAAVAFVWALVQLQRTARREERRLLASAHGAGYAAYMGRTGRFTPRLRSGSTTRHAVGSLPERT
jgi:protein-S-isoprenylcysteine O-methyltransferase Ste14